MCCILALVDVLLLYIYRFNLLLNLIGDVCLVVLCFSLLFNSVVIFLRFEFDVLFGAWLLLAKFKVLHLFFGSICFVGCLCWFVWLVRRLFAVNNISCLGWYCCFALSLLGMLLRCFVYWYNVGIAVLCLGLMLVFWNI